MAVTEGNSLKPRVGAAFIPTPFFLSPVFGGLESECFAADRELIDGVVRARSLHGVEDEVRDYFIVGRP